MQALRDARELHADLKRTASLEAMHQQQVEAEEQQGGQEETHDGLGGSLSSAVKLHLGFGKKGSKGGTPVNMHREMGRGHSHGIRCCFLCGAYLLLILVVCVEGLSARVVRQNHNGCIISSLLMSGQFAIPTLSTPHPTPSSPFLIDWLWLSSKQRIGFISSLHLTV